MEEGIILVDTETMILSLDYSLIEDLESEFTIQIVLSAGDTQNIYFLTFQFEEEILEN